MGKLHSSRVRMRVRGAGFAKSFSVSIAQGKTTRHSNLAAAVRNPGLSLV